MALQILEMTDLEMARIIAGAAVLEVPILGVLDETRGLHRDPTSPNPLLC